MLLAHLQQRLADVEAQSLSRRKARFSSLSAALDAMSPLKVLGRGYAVARTEQGEILKSARNAAAGDRVHVTLGEGGLLCRVEKTEEQS